MKHISSKPSPALTLLTVSMAVLLALARLLAGLAGLASTAAAVLLARHRRAPLAPAVRLGLFVDRLFAGLLAVI